MRKPAKNRNLTNSAARASSRSRDSKAAVDPEQQVVARLFRHIDLVEVHLFQAAALALCRLAPRMLDQDPAHGLGGGGEKVPAILPSLALAWPCQSEPSLMH
jgi:hypothetical protein